MKLRRTNQLGCHRRLLANLHSGHVYIWNYNDQTVVKSFQVTEAPGPPWPPAGSILKRVVPLQSADSQGLSASPDAWPAAQPCLAKRRRVMRTMRS